jgi:hypothetical protein
MGVHASSEPKKQVTLNVIFHGAYVFDQYTEPKHFLVSMPRMKHHVYRAGNWLAETELRGSDTADASEAIYALKGVEQGTVMFDEAAERESPKNLLLYEPREDRPRVLPHATIRLPLPKAITSLRVAKIPRDKFNVADDLVLAGDQHIATLQIFTYDVTNPNDVCLEATTGEGHFWEPAPLDGYINLHVFAAEDHFHKFSNAQEDFNECVRLLGNEKLELKTATLLADGPVDEGQLPNGVIKEETETLAFRTGRMAKLGRIIKQERDEDEGEGDKNLTWYGNDALDGSEEACAGPVVVNRPPR